jgi:hypothetical protein
MADVPFGTYDYTITTEGCRVATGQVTVNCSNTDPNNPTPTVAVFAVQGDAVAIDISVIQNSEVLTANASGANISYQWVDCDNGNAPISGETNQSFTATINGNYAVIITNNDCPSSDISNCFMVSTLSLESVNSSLDLKLYPNPVIDDLTINFGNSYNNIDVQIYSMVGQLVRAIKITNSIEYRFNMSDLATGTYVIRINADGKSTSSLMIKK